MYLTKKEVAEAFGVTPLTVDNWAAKRTIEKSYDKSRVTFSKTSVLAEIKRQKAEAEDKLDTLKRALVNLEIDNDLF